MLARHGAERIELSAHHPDEEPLEILEPTSKEVLEESSVWTHTLRPPRRREGDSEAIITKGR